MNEKEKLTEVLIKFLTEDTTNDTENYTGFNLIEDWKQKELEGYLNTFDKEMNHIDELETKCKEHNWNIDTLEEYRQIPMIFKQFRFNRNKDEFEKLAQKEVESHFKKLQSKVEKYIGNIQKINPTGNNGYDYEFIGDKGQCEVQVILAGGYNVQRLHTRWIIKK